MKWNSNAGKTVSDNGYEVIARPAKAKKNNGHDVYHRNSTRRVWVAFASSQAEGKRIAESGKLPVHR